MYWFTVIKTQIYIRIFVPGNFILRIFFEQYVISQKSRYIIFIIIHFKSTQVYLYKIFRALYINISIAILNLTMRIRKYYQYHFKLDKADIFHNLRTFFFFKLHFINTKFFSRKFNNAEISITGICNLIMSRY